MAFRSFVFLYFIVSLRAETLKVTLQVQRDTLFIGEPLVVTKIVENKGKGLATVLPPTLSVGVQCGELTLLLFSPENRCYEYRQGISLSPVWKKVRRCTILPGKRVFVRDMLWWENFLGSFVREDFKKLPKGEYKLQMRWSPYLGTPDKNLDVESETCRFYAVPLKGEDVRVCEELRKARGYIIGWGGSSDRKEMHKRATKALERKSRLREYAMFLQAITADDEERKIELLKRFVEEFPKSHLSLEAKEEIIWWEWRMGKRDKEALRKEARKLRSDNPGYRFRYLRRGILE